MCLGIPGQVEMLDTTFSLAKVDISGVKRNVNVSLVAAEGLAPGDWVLIHVGLALSKIDEHEAQETLKLLQQMGSTYTDELKQLHQSQIDGGKADEQRTGISTANAGNKGSSG